MGQTIGHDILKFRLVLLDPNIREDLGTHVECLETEGLSASDDQRFKARN